MINTPPSHLAPLSHPASGCWWLKVLVKHLSCAHVLRTASFASFRRLTVVDLLTLGCSGLVAGKDRWLRDAAHVCMHACVCRDGVEFTSACECSSAPFLPVYCVNERLRKRPAGQTSKGLFILVSQWCILVKWQAEGHGVQLEVGQREIGCLFMPSVSHVHIEAATGQQKLHTRGE